MSDNRRDNLRRKYPKLSEASLDEVERLLDVKPMSRQERWAAEQSSIESAPELPLDADGLTEPMRRCNAYADRHGLPQPFRRRGDTHRRLR